MNSQYGTSTIQTYTAIAEHKVNALYTFWGLSIQ